MECKENLNILDYKASFAFCSFKTINNKLPIETGSWQKHTTEEIVSVICVMNIKSVMNITIFFNVFFSYPAQRTYKSGFFSLIGIA